MEEMTEEMERPGYYAVIPADVRYDQSLPPNAKLLYGEISALIGKDGFCYASNSYFGQIYGLTSKSVSRLVTSLEKGNYIMTKLDHDKSGKVERRRIYLKVSLPEIQPVDNFGDTPPQNCPGGIPKKEEETNTRYTNRKDAPAKKKKQFLTDEQIKTFAVEWIKKHGASWTSSEKNSLYASVCAFYEPRETKRETPLKSPAAVKMLFARLLNYGAGDPAVMTDMLQRATCGKWKSVYPPDRDQTPAAAQKREEQEWL